MKNHGFRYWVICVVILINIFKVIVTEDLLICK